MRAKEKGEKNAKEKRISLIVLVITIIVMIVLAGAIILSLNNAGIIGNANKAVEDSNIANIKAAADLAYAEYLLDNSSISDGNNLGEKITNTLIANGIITEENYIIGIYDNETVVAKKGTAAYDYYKGNIKIGDYVKYDYTPVSEGTETTYISYKEQNGYANQVFKLKESYNSDLYGWQVMGIDKEGRLLLLSEDIIRPVDNTGYSYNNLSLFAFNAIKDRTLEENVKQELENVCDLYGNGKGASNARSITVEDVNKITGYTQEYMKLYLKGELAGYGNKITYSWINKDGEIKVLCEANNENAEYHTDTLSFEWFDNNGYHIENAPDTLEQGTKKKITTITNNYYKYYPESLSLEQSVPEGNKGYVKEGTVEYDLLFKDNSATINNCIYWLASSYVHMSATQNAVTTGYRRVKTGYVTGGTLMDSLGTKLGNYAGVRVVVSLKSDVVLEKTQETVTIGEKTLNKYIIK